MLLSGLSLVEDQIDVLGAHVEQLRASDGTEAQWSDVARLAARARGAWRGVEAAAAPGINPMRRHVQADPAATATVNSRGYEGIWRYLHIRIKARMDAVDRALLDRDPEALATAVKRVRDRVAETYELASVGDIGSPSGSDHPELAMMSSGLKRIDWQLGVLSFCLSQLSQEGETELQREERLGDVAEQVELVKGIWWGVEGSVANFIDPDRSRLGTMPNSLSGSIARGELFSELKLGTEVSVSLISKAFQAGDFAALARAIGGTHRQIDRSRQAIANADGSPGMNGVVNKPLVL
jgi:hypothetical protein